MLEGSVLFKEKEQLVGYVTLDSGCLLLVDGVWDSAQIKQSEKIRLDLGETQPIRVPVTTVLQGGRRYVLLDIDGASRLPALNPLVEVEDPVEMPVYADDDEDAK